MGKVSESMNSSCVCLIFLSLLLHTVRIWTAFECGVCGVLFEIVWFLYRLFIFNRTKFNGTPTNMSKFISLKWQDALKAMKKNVGKLRRKKNGRTQKNIHRKSSNAQRNKIANIINDIFNLSICKFILLETATRGRYTNILRFPSFWPQNEQKIKS